MKERPDCSIAVFLEMSDLFHSSRKCVQVTNYRMIIWLLIDVSSRGVSSQDH